MHKLTELWGSACQTFIGQTRSIETRQELMIKFLVRVLTQETPVLTIIVYNRVT